MWGPPVYMVLLLCFFHIQNSPPAVAFLGLDAFSVPFPLVYYIFIRAWGLHVAFLRHLVSHSYILPGSIIIIKQLPNVK